MDIQEILSKVDHTLLSVTAGWEDIKTVLDDAKRFKTASACIPPAFVKRAKEYVGEDVKICTVIGFPNGYSTIESKVFETADAVENGADEIDMVINIGELKAGNTEYVSNEIASVKKACEGKVLKVIIETCLLSDNEKTEMCRIVTDTGADYIKTSTGFSTAGATFDDIELFSRNIGEHVKMKAAGGIKSLDDAEHFIKLGCSRLGTSSVIRIVKEQFPENID